MTLDEAVGEVLRRYGHDAYALAEAARRGDTAAAIIVHRAEEEAMGLVEGEGRSPLVPAEPG